MKSALSRRNLIVKKSSIHGYGVFAGENIKSDEIIEECHTIILSVQYADIENYTFDGDGKSAIVLGYGSIYNHSKERNAVYEYDKEKSVMVFRASKPIKKGEEIFISYGDNWFSSRNAIVREPSWRHKVSQLYKTLQFFLRGVYVTGFLTMFIIICQLYVSTRV